MKPRWAVVEVQKGWALGVHVYENREDADSAFRKIAIAAGTATGKEIEAAIDSYWPMLKVGEGSICIRSTD
jgi:hypothetical protein